MLEMIWNPTLYGFDTCKEFAEAFRLNRDDLILSNAYIYEPYFGCMENLNCYVIFQEKYGAGEPTDVMVDAILADAAKTSCKRVIAIGGGTVIDIAKVLAVSDGEGVDDLYDKAPDLEKKRELIIIPTTCGTGSEVTNISIMARTRIGTKLGLVSPGRACRARGSPPAPSTPSATRWSPPCPPRPPPTPSSLAIRPLR